MSLILLPVLLTHMMFSGLRSRWTMPCLWMKLTPSMICSMYLMTSLSVSSKSSSMIRSNSSPPEILQPQRHRQGTSAESRSGVTPESVLHSCRKFTYISSTMTMSDLPSKASMHWTSLG